MQKNSKAKNKGKVVKNKKNKSQKLPMILLIGAIVLIVAGVGGYLLANKGLPGGGFNIMKPQPVEDSCRVQYCTNCKPNNPNYCVTCSSGYTQQNGKCVESCNVSNCKECVSGNSNKCKNCNGGYTVTYDGKCGDHKKHIKSANFESFNQTVYTNQKLKAPYTVYLNFASSLASSIRCKSSNSEVVETTVGAGGTRSASSGYLIETGAYCAYLAKKPGTATISIYNYVTQKTYDSKKINVKAAKVSSIALSPSSLSTYGVGGSGDNNYLEVIFTPSYATNKNITCVSSNTSIAIATAKYNYCVITHPKNNPTSKGKVTITAISKDGNKKASATVNMLPFLEVKSIGFQQSTYSLNVGHNMTLYKVVNPTNAYYGKVHSCGVENNGVLKLVEEPTTGCRVRGLKKGTAKVTIWDATGTYKGVATVKVK